MTRRLLLVLALLAPALAEAQTTHRYWRYLVSATAYPSAPGDVCLIVESEMRSSIGGADLTGTGTAAASSLYAGSSAAYAFDDSTGTNWASQYPPGADDNAWWLRYDFGSGTAYALAEVTITAGTGGNEAGAPTAFSVQCSDDASSWTTASSFSGQSWTSGETKTFSVAACSIGATCTDVSMGGFWGCY